MTMKKQGLLKTDQEESRGEKEDEPSPAASTPISLTDLSSIKGWKVPIAFDPPPTQATTAVGNFPVKSASWDLISDPMTDWKSRTIVGKG